MNIVGLDVGSTTAKAVWLKNGKISFKIVSTHNWRSLIEEVKKELGDVKIVSTGYFRKKVEHDFTITEITASIYGVKDLLRRDIDAIVDIGGQDTKVVDVKRNDFKMNDKCSAGTGAFFELVANYFKIDVKELGKLHFASKKVPKINSTCSVFALSEIVSKLVEGYSKEDIIRGLHFSFINRIIPMIPKDAKKIALIGGVAKNAGIVDAFSRYFKVYVPKEPQIVNAYGCIAYYEKLGL